MIEALFKKIIGFGLIFLVKALQASKSYCQQQLDIGQQYVFYANHCSNLDTLVIWACLPHDIRAKTRPVAARDYWTKTAVRRFVALKVLNVVLVDRLGTVDQDPLEPLRQALNEGFNLIIFPEGKRNIESIPGVFRSGIFQLKTQYTTKIKLVPVYLTNVNRSFPKGAVFPIPIRCDAYFGKEFETKNISSYDLEKGSQAFKDFRAEFLLDAHAELVSLIPSYLRKN